MDRLVLRGVNSYMDRLELRGVIHIWTGRGSGSHSFVGHLVCYISGSHS